MLDFAVTSSDLDERRKYIQRIMSLSKSVQKILMNLIERMKKTLPRKPRNAKSSRPDKTSRSPSAAASGKDGQVATDLPSVPGPAMPIKPVTDTSTSIDNQNDANKINDDYSDAGSDVTPPDEPPQRLRAFTTPKRERNVHGIPQSEPPKSTRLPLSQERSRSASRPRKPEQEDAQTQTSKPRQPEGYYMPALQKKICGNGFASPLKDRQQPLRMQIGNAASCKQRHTSDSLSSSLMPLQSVPLRERQMQMQRAAFVSINNQSRHHGTLTRKLAMHTPPPPPPPPFPVDQQMPATTTPSDELTPTDELELHNHMSIPLTETTQSTVDSSLGSNTDLAVLMVNSSIDSKHRSMGKAIALDKRRHSGTFASPSRRASSAESPIRNRTPELSLASHERDVDARMMFSPDGSVLQSPLQVDDFVKELRAKNKSLESILQSYQKRERELSQKMESTESKLRKEMMKLESRALGREDELRRTYDHEVAKLKKDLRDEQEKNKESKRAREELANANDELDLMQHTHEKLLEATEKIRKYKERIDSLNDYKEAFEREQEAHSKSVHECVRLQDELQMLLPLKRQLDEYRTKALEMEVKLAECKDSLSKLQRERDELDNKRSDLLSEAMAQRAQAEELKKFIQIKDAQNGPGIGEGIR